VRWSEYPRKVSIHRESRDFAVFPVDEPTEAFQEFTRNLNYARQLVDGGRRLAQLKVGAFDVDDLYRAAWVQAVAALDHWVTREIVDRAVALARQPGAARPPKFNKLMIPVELFEQVHHHDKPLDVTFRDHLEQTFGYVSFQNPEKIKDGLAHVSTVNLWVKVAELLTEHSTKHSTDGQSITADLVRERFRNIARRRNTIAHTADRDPESPGKRAIITADQTAETIDWLETTGAAILSALGTAHPAPDIDAIPESAGAVGEAPATPTNQPFVATRIRGRSQWDETTLRETIENYSTPEVASTLLAIYRHAESHPGFRGYYFGEAKTPSVTAWFNFGTDEAAIWSIYTGVLKSVLSINFEWMHNRGAPTTRLDQLANALSQLPHCQHLPTELTGSDYAKRPSLGPETLTDPKATEIIIRALNDFLAPTDDLSP
jgi:hypothetical protein